jgi:hypothetical protein
MVRQRLSWKTLPVLGLALGLGAQVTARAQARAPTELTAEDRAAIQDLGARYARALSTCAAEDYADLFASPGGYFGSGSRGELIGRDRLIALVRSEPRCANATADAAGNTAGPSSGSGPAVTIGQSAEGVTGKTMVGTGGGFYEDVYVKTPAGWRFKSRNVLSASEASLKLTIQDFMAIRRLAGDDGNHFDDVYTDSASAPHSSATPGARPGRLLRASGLVITATPEGATGKAFLRNGGGSYEDVYVRTANGWRFKSRVYVPAVQESAAANGTPGPR